MISEADWEADMLDWLGELGWEPGTGSDIDGQRRSAADLVLQTDLLNALRRLNPDVPDQRLAEAAAEITAPKSQDAIAENERLHDFLVHGFRGLTYIDTQGREQTPTLRLLSDNPTENTYRAIHQVTIVSGQHSRRFDVVLYVNGLPLVIAELKKASASASITDAYNQLQTYLTEFPTAFRTVVATVISDGLEAKYGTPFTPSNHFTPWNLYDHGERIDDDKRVWSICATACWNRIALSTSSSTSSPSNTTTASPRRSPNRTSTWRSARPSSAPWPPSTPTGRPASSGTPRDRASRWRWSSTPTW